MFHKKLFLKEKRKAPEGASITSKTKKPRQEYVGWERPQTELAFHLTM